MLLNLIHRFTILFAEKEVNVIKQIANTGKDWDYFKPQDSHSLYRLVLNETGSIKVYCFP